MRHGAWPRWTLHPSTAGHAHHFSQLPFWMGEEDPLQSTQMQHFPGHAPGSGHAVERGRIAARARGYNAAASVAGNGRLR